jgi:hypothetical protein
MSENNPWARSRRHAYQRVLSDQPVHCPVIKHADLTSTSAARQTVGLGTESRVQTSNNFLVIRRSDYSQVRNGIEKYWRSSCGMWRRVVCEKCIDVSVDPAAFFIRSGLVCLPWWRKHQDSSKCRYTCIRLDGVTWQNCSLCSNLLWELQTHGSQLQIRKMYSGDVWGWLKWSAKWTCKKTLFRRLDETLLLL